MDNEEKNELRGIREMVSERARLQREDWSTGYVIRDVTDVERLLLHLERQLARQSEDIWYLKRERAAAELLEDAREPVYARALDLLAVIHGDGGHHTASVGVETSFDDAENAVTALRTALGEVRCGR